jgi:crotonobetainyl-CoA:carnitine CoA-transferase CaiB-like acyl-CoA transferase
MAFPAQALEGIRVVEFTQGMAGPWIGRTMAWCGAEVIRVESRKVPGVVRLYVSPHAPEAGTQAEMSPWFTDWDAGKLFVALDLKQPAGVELAKRLVARADIAVENHRHGAMEKLGLGWDVLEAVNASLIGLSSSGFGDGGPHPHYVTWGPNIEAMSGLARLSGFPERECAMTQYAYPDALSALHGLFAILCALDHRDRTGQGQRISIAQIETTVAMIGPEMMDQLAHDRTPPRLGNASRHMAPHGCYPCAGDDRWCAITVRSNAEWQRLGAVDALAALVGDPRFETLDGRLAGRAEIDEALAAWTRDQDAYAIVESLQDLGVTAGVVQTTEDQYQHDAHLAARRYFEHVPHLRKGEVVATGIPLGLTGTPGRTTRAGAAMGEDNAHVFRDLLGLSADEYARYVDAGAIEEAD